MTGRKNKYVPPTAFETRGANVTVGRTNTRCYSNIFTVIEILSAYFVINIRAIVLNAHEQKNS